MRLPTVAIVLVLAIAGCSSDRVESEAKLPPAKFRDEQRVEQARKQYPFESLESRLPGRPPVSPGHPQLSEVSKKELHWIDEVIDGDNERESVLRTLHDGTIAEFVSKQGFGVRRMPLTPEEILAHAQRAPEPRGPQSESWREVDIAAEPVNLDLEKLNFIHRLNTFYGINRAGFGFIKSRKQVAGFQAHRFERVHDSPPWTVRRIELVSLLIAETPRVYITDGLPRMDEVRNVPTRELDSFESSGLAKLRAGAFVFIREGIQGIRMLGAIRNAKQCIQCHGGDRGDLLGAFSYCVQREPE